MSRPPVSILIPNWNGLDLLQRFLPSVIESAAFYGETFDSETELIVVDDSSTDDSVRWLEEHGFQRASLKRESAGVGTDRPARVLYVNETNSGFGRACNAGFRIASNRLVLLLNNDVEPARNFIAPLTENFADPTVFAAHCRVWNLRSGIECGTGKLGGFSRGFIRVHRSWKPRVESDGFAANYDSMFAGGGSAMFDRDKWLELGGFEELLSPYYWEDVELSYRAWKRGYRVAFEPRSHVRHLVSSTIGKLNRGRVRTMEQRNRLVFHWINLHDKRMLASHVCWVAIVAITSALTFRPRFISALRDALGKLPEVRSRRKRERAAANISDRELFRRFEEMESRGDLVAYDSVAELES